MLVNPYNGYYLYNEVPFGTADEVLYSIIKNNDSSPNLRLWFHDELFSKINWTQEPIDTLENLYIARAKQLREQYDYLILQFSGGSDSSQVLQTFLRNNIFLDEIRSYYPIKIAKRFSDTILYNDRHNSLGYYWEYFGACLPQLKIVAEKSPKTKINVIDYSERYVNDLKKDNVVTDNKNAFILTSPLRASENEDGSWWNIIRNIVTQKNLEDTEKIKKTNIAVILGAEKPKFTIIDKSLYFNFTSFGRSTAAIQPTYSNNKYTEEFFYWTPNFPLIPIKQSHVILNFLNMNNSVMNLFISIMLNNKIEKIKFYESVLMKKIIYPYYNEFYYFKNKKYNGLPVSNFSDEFGQESFAQQIKYIKTELSTINIPSLISLAKSKNYYVGQLQY